MKRKTDRTRRWIASSNCRCQSLELPRQCASGNTRVPYLATADRQRVSNLPQLLYNTAMAEHPAEIRNRVSAPLSEVRNRLSEIVDEAASTGADFIITKHGRAAAVIIGHDEYEALIETLNILSDADSMAAISEAEEQLESGDVIPLEELD